MAILENLHIQCDSSKLWNECEHIIKKYGDHNQFALTHRKDVTDPIERIFDGTGSLFGRPFFERGFNVFNEEFSGSYIEMIYKNLPLPIGRFRIMRVKSRTCYSVHVDTTKRIHIPLITNEQALMIFPSEKEIVHLPIDNIWLTDTTIQHTAMNGGLKDRYHLVASLAEDPSYKGQNQ